MRKMHLYIYTCIRRSEEKESQRRNTTHSFSRSFVCLLRRMKKKSKNTYIQIHRGKKREMLRWNTFSHDYPDQQTAARWREKKRNKREREFNDENSCWLTCLFAKERIRARCFLFFPCSSFHIHIHKLNRKTICFIFCSCLSSSFPLCYSLFSFIYNVDSSFFYKCEMFARFVLFLLFFLDR